MELLIKFDTSGKEESFRRSFHEYVSKPPERSFTINNQASVANRS